jgi:hypothetical protein
LTFYGIVGSAQCLESLIHNVLMPPIPVIRVKPTKKYGDEPRERLLGVSVGTSDARSGLLLTSRLRIPDRDNRLRILPLAGLVNNHTKVTFH